MSALQKYIKRQPKGAISAMARSAGVTHAQMSRIVSGKRGASLGVIRAISRHTGLSLEAVVSAVSSARAPQRRV